MISLQPGTHKDFELSLSDVNKAFADVGKLTGPETWPMWKFRVETALQTIVDFYASRANRTVPNEVTRAVFNVMTGHIGDTVMANYMNENMPHVLMEKLREPVVARDVRRASEHGEDRLVVLAAEVGRDQVDHGEMLRHAQRVRDTIGHAVDVGHGRSHATIVALFWDVRLHADGNVHETEDAKLRQAGKVGELLLVPGLPVVYVWLDL